MVNLTHFGPAMRRHACSNTVVADKFSYISPGESETLVASFLTLASGKGITEGRNLSDAKVLDHSWIFNP